MAKQMIYGDAARQELKKGLSRLADAVKVTMGPTGRNVILDKSFGGPSVTKDGVSVAKEVEVKEVFENMGAKMVVEVARKTNDKAGDGTTTATVLAEAIYLEGLRMVNSGCNPVAVQRGINTAAQIAAKAIKKSAKPCKGEADYKKIASVSANHDSVIGDLIASAIARVGATGVVEIEDSSGSQSTVEFVEGMNFDKGYLSPYFMTDTGNQTCVYEDAYILIFEKKINNLPDLLPLLNKVVASGKPLLIIAEDVESEALTTLVVNRLRGSLPICAVKAPGFGDRRKSILQDIAVLTKGTFISEDLGMTLEQVELEHLGVAKKIVVDKDNTTIVEGAGSKADLKARCTQIENAIKKSTSDYDKEKLAERLAKLTGGVAIIHVGANTEAELKEKKDRVDDALHATKAAALEGYVAGGGVAFIRAISNLESERKHAKGDEKLGFDIVANALEVPAKQIAENGGIDGDIVVETIKEGKNAYGYNASRDNYEDLIKAGIIDPALVSHTALTNAASVAGLMLTTQVMIADIKDDEEPVVGAIV